MTTGQETALLQSSFWAPLIDGLGVKALIMIGVLAVAALTARRAGDRGISPEQPANQLALGLLIGLPMACQLYLFWQSPGVAAPLDQLGADRLPPAMFALVLAAALAGLASLRWWRLPLLARLDVCAPVVLLGQVFAQGSASLGRLAQSAAQPGQALAPLALLEGLVPPLVTVAALLWVERNTRVAMRPGDSALLCGLLYALGALIAGAFGAAQGGLHPLHLLILALCGGVLALRRLRLSATARRMRRSGAS